MQPANLHIAELNIGQLWHPLDDPRTAGFTDNAEKVNAVAERSSGFVWRCVEEKAALRSEGISLYDGDPCSLSTMSVWKSPVELSAFVFKTIHGSFLKRRSDWFKPQDHLTYVIWPIAAGHIPSFQEGLDKLASLSTNGPTGDAYDFKYLRQHLADQT